MLVVIGLIAYQFYSRQNQPTVNKERFHFSISPLTRADRFLLDSYTGDMWQVVQNAEGQQVLQPVPVLEKRVGNFEKLWNEADVKGK